MTDHDDADIELVSAYLDGEASTDEVARIESDPHLRALAERLQAAREVIAAPIAPLPEPEWDVIVAGARQEVDAEAPVTDLSARRSRRAPMVLVGVAAAALLIVAFAFALTRNNATPPPGEFAQPGSSASVPPPPSSGDDQTGVGVSGSGTTTPAQAVDEFRAVYVPRGIGSFDDAQLLAGAAAGATPTTEQPPGSVVAPTDPNVQSVARCVAAVRRDERRLGRIRLATPATFQGKPVYVLVFQEQGVASGREPRRVVVVGRDSCAVAASVPV